MRLHEGVHWVVLLSPDNRPFAEWCHLSSAGTVDQVSVNATSHATLTRTISWTMLEFYDAHKTAR